MAQADLEELYDYIARDSRYYAEQFVERLFDSVAVLAEPLIGRRVPEAEEREDVRELNYHGYRIIYVVQPTDVFVLTVIHGSRDLEARSLSIA